jgi:integrase
MTIASQSFLNICGDVPIDTIPFAKRNRKMARFAELGRTERSRAKVISEGQLKQTLSYLATRSRSFESDKLKMLLSVRAGLRACEIAALNVGAFLDPEGKIAAAITIEKKYSKNKRARTVPMHPEIHCALERLMQVKGRAWNGNIAFSCCQERTQCQSANTVAQWFRRVYQRAGLVGCSSHSGRRTFVTTLARSANQYGRSLRDVQYLAGHACLNTTAAYIDLSPELTTLVGSLGGKSLGVGHAA